MIITEIVKARQLARAREQPNLVFTTFSVHDRLEEVRKCHFPKLGHGIEVYFVSRGPLACVCNIDLARTIYIHQVLNHWETPVEVVDLICKHELLHLQIPPVVEGKKRIQHPPEFWAAERDICLEKNLAWSWIWMNLWPCLNERPRLERIDVLPSWKKVWSEPKLDAATCQRQWVHGRPKERDETVS